MNLQDEAERPFTRFDTLVPAATSDPATLWEARIVPPDGPPEDGPSDDFTIRARNLARAYTGQPQILHVHACLITLLRRRAAPDHAADLFNRLWAFDPQRMAEALDPRWRISAAETFADHGVTEQQRRAGLSLTILCKTVKLYESERLFSGLAPDSLFPGTAKAVPLALNLTSVALVHGDVDRGLITRLLRDAEGDPVAAALVWSLVPDLFADARGVFHRLRRMRKRRLQRRGGSAPE